MSATWEESVERARTANRRAIEGRFRIALASFEQFAAFGRGYMPEGRGGKVAHRTLADFADEVGISYYTLNGYRGVASWWFEGEPLNLLEEIGIPENVAWEALRFAKGHWPLVVDFRALLDDVENAPANGRMWSLADVEYLARVEKQKPKPEPRRQEPELFAMALTSVERVGARLARLSGELRDADLSDAQREQLTDAIERTKSSLAGLEGQIARELVS